MNEAAMCVARLDVGCLRAPTDDPRANGGSNHALGSVPLQKLMAETFGLTMCDVVKWADMDVQPDCFELSNPEATR